MGVILGHTVEETIARRSRKQSWIAQSIKRIKSIGTGVIERKAGSKIWRVFERISIANELRSNLIARVPLSLDVFLGVLGNLRGLIFDNDRGACVGA